MKLLGIKKCISFLLLLALALGLCACTERAATSGAQETPVPAETARAEETPDEDDPPASAQTDAPPEQTPAATPSPTPEQTPEPTEEPWPGPDLAEQEPADGSFFSDAVFLGNSMVRGLELWGALPGDANGGPDFFAISSATLVSVDKAKNFSRDDGSECTQLDALCQKQYGKVYVLFGVNEIYFETDYFISLYSELLDKLTEREPLAEIYIMSLCPITEQRSGDSSPYTEEKVLEYNAALYELATSRGCWYVDDVAALAGEDGYLPAEYAQEDGVHLWPNKYPLWGEYLRTHYHPDGDLL